MANQTATILKLVTIFVIVAGLVVCLTSTVSRHWVTGSAFRSGVLLYDIKSGIWDYCIETPTQDECTDALDQSNSEDKLRVVRGFALLAIIAITIGLIVSILSFPYKIFNIPLIVLLFLTAIFQGVAMGVSKDTMEDMKGPLVGFDWSYDVGWVGFGLSLLAAILSVVMTITDKRD